MNRAEFGELLAKAIEREVEAMEFYNGLALRSKDPFVKDLFADLAKQELGHQEVLERFRFDDTLQMDFEKVEDWKIAETVQTPELSLEMKPRDAIALAMKKEEAAAKLYTDLARSCKSAAHKNLYLNLAAMELGHKHRLENVFIDVGYPEVF
ncbi:MAG TPA: ferritin family protein [Myxococcota bacterium]|nr:ferritin family protein [Myxococcota bacterium]HRY95689.1 ferritin family protein [Myxococcota bacterium]HSA20195.1 ferritin family protein [Myxococcota bacterium]